MLVRACPASAGAPGGIADGIPKIDDFLTMARASLRFGFRQAVTTLTGKVAGSRARPPRWQPRPKA
jgi:hypothetical protein